MNKKILVFILSVVILGFVYLAEAQQPKKIPHIGLLGAGSPSSYSTRIPALREGLRELGYTEGKNIVIEYRYAEGNLDRLPDLAVELVDLKVDIILATSDPSVRAAMKATQTIPIVFTSASDPVASQFVISLAQPGGNATGLANLFPELSGKRLDLLKEVFPKISRVAIFFGPGGVIFMQETETAAKVMGLHLQPFLMRGLDDFEAAFETAKKQGAQALLTTPSPIISTAEARIVEFAAKNRLPAMYAQPEFVDAGGLMSYAPSYTDLFHRAATYVDKILKGTRPADLPVEQPTKFEFIINLKAAKQLGVTIPQSVLYRADRVIK